MAGSSSNQSQNSSSNSSQSTSTSKTAVLDYAERPFLSAIAQFAGTAGQDVYNRAQTEYAKTSALTDANISNYLNTSQATNNQAAKYAGAFDRGLQQFDNLNQKANEYASEGRLDSNMAAAESAQMQGNESALANHKRDLQAYGVDPSSGRYAGLDEAARVQGAAAAVGAAQRAREDTLNRADQYQSQALNFASQMPGAQINALNTSLQGFAGAQNAALANANTGVSLTGAANPFLQTASSYKPVVGTDSASNSSSSGSSQGTSSGSSQTTDPAQQAKDQSQPKSPQSQTGSGDSSGGSGGYGGISSGSGSSGSGSYDGGSVWDNGSGVDYSGLDGSNWTSGGGLADYTGDWSGATMPGGFEDYSSDAMPGGGEAYNDYGGYGGGFSDYGGGGYDSGGGGGYDTGSMDYGGGGGGEYFAEGGAIPDYDDGGGAIPESVSPSGGARVDDVRAQTPGGASIRVNAGEFIIPDDVARWKGEEFFQKLIAQSRQARVTAPAKPAQSPPRQPPMGQAHGI